MLILVDDMEYSDLGCYGGEIPTPNIDELTENGNSIILQPTEMNCTMLPLPPRQLPIKW